MIFMNVDNISVFLLAIFLPGYTEECQREANRKKTVTMYKYLFKYHRNISGSIYPYTFRQASVNFS